MIHVNKIHKFTCINTIKEIFNTWWKQVNTNTNSTKGNLFCIGSRGGGYTGCNCSVSFKEMGGKPQWNKPMKRDKQRYNYVTYICLFHSLCTCVTWINLSSKFIPPGPFEKNSGSATDICVGKTTLHDKQRGHILSGIK